MTVVFLIWQGPWVGVGSSRDSGHKKRCALNRQEWSVPQTGKAPNPHFYSVWLVCVRGLYKKHYNTRKPQEEEATTPPPTSKRQGSTIVLPEAKKASQPLPPLSCRNPKQATVASEAQVQGQQSMDDMEELFAGNFENAPSYVQSSQNTVWPNSPRYL